MLTSVKTAIEIYKLLPKTNCGACGLPNCFGFATKLAAHMASVDDCPDITGENRDVLRNADVGGRESTGTVYEQALASLKEKIKAVDFKKAAGLFRAVYRDRDTITIEFLHQRYLVTKQAVLTESGKEVRPWIAILIYNHLCMPAPPATAGEWISFSAIPQSHAKDKAWKGHVEEVIARHFSGKVEELKRACENFGCVKTDHTGSHDAAYMLRFFPLFPVLLLFWDVVPEEGFPAQCTLLLDKHAPYYLDIESIVVLGEEFAARLTE